MASVLSVSRVWVLAHAEFELDAEQQQAFRALVERRARGEPVAYLRGEVEWHGLALEVGSAVLIPRPETELLVEAAVELGRRRPPSVIADIGTGSGAIAIALASHFPSATVYATDRSGDALAIAARNAARHHVTGRIHFLQGDLIDPLPRRPDLLAANLPYLADWMMDELPEPVRYEPGAALRAGPTGLELYKRLFEQIAGRGWSMPFVLEIDARQGDQARRLAALRFPGAQIRVLRDYAGLDRVVSVVL
jgi:release factor glutamine methyltransferase